MGGKYLTVYNKDNSNPHPGSMDIYSLGQIIKKCYSSLSLPIPDDMDALVTKMTKQDPKRRGSCNQIVSSAAFRSDYILLMTSLEELSLKPAHESIEILGK